MKAQFFVVNKKFQSYDLQPRKIITKRLFYVCFKVSISKRDVNVLRGMKRLQFWVKLKKKAVISNSKTI